MTDYTVGATIHIAFTTRAFATGIPTVLIGTAGSPAAPVVAAYEDAGLVQITAGITLGVDHDSPAVVGLNMLTIVATGGNGFESGKDYNLVITNGTVGGVSVVGEVVGRFTIGRSAAAVDLANGTDGLGAIKSDTSSTIDLVNGLGGSTGGSVSIQTVLDNTVTDTTDAAAAVDKGTSPETVGVPVTGHAFVAGQQVTLAGTTNYNGSFDVDSVTANEVVIVATFAAETFGGSDTIVSSVKGVVFVGSVQAGTVASTEALDGVLHDIDDVGNDIDMIYTFSVGAGRTGTEIIFHGFVQGNGDTIDIEVYDHVGTDWEILRTITGANGTSNITLEVPLLLKHTGTSGLDTGRVYVRYDTNATTPSNLSIDQLLVEAINTGNLNAYDNGRIWINTNKSNTNTVADVDGTTRRAVSTIAAAKTLSTKTELGDFHVSNGSSFTLAESTVNESYFGDNWTLALGGQDVADAHFQGARVSGVGVSATEVHYVGCDIATMSVQIGHFDFCSFDGTVTLTLAGDYNYHNCKSKVAGVGGPTFAKTAGQTITAQWRDWSGTITVSGIESGDVMTISGTELGDVVLNGADGTVKILGVYESLTDNRTGAPTLIEGAYEGSDVTDILEDTGTTLDTKLNDMQGATFSGATDSLEAIRNRGDAAWITAVGFSTHNAAAVWSVVTRALTDKADFALSTAGILAIWHQAVSAIVSASTIGKLLKDEITSVRMATLTDWINGGRLDTLLDAIPTTAMRGTDSAALASVATEARLAELDAGNLPSDVDDILTNIAALNDYDPTAQLVESYAANGVAPTTVQLQFAIHQMIMQFGISGTSLTVRKLDNTTTAFVVTLDDATNPTDAKRV